MLRIPIILLILETLQAVEEHSLPGTDAEAAHTKGLDTRQSQRTHLRVKEPRQARAKIDAHPHAFTERSPGSRSEEALLALSQRLQVLGANRQRGRARGCEDSFGTTLDPQTTVVDLDTTGGCRDDDRKTFVHFAGGDADSCVPPTPPEGCHRYVVVHYEDCDLTEAASELGDQNTTDKFNTKGELISCAEKVKADQSTVYIFGAKGEEENCKQEDACGPVEGAKPAGAAEEPPKEEPAEPEPPKEQFNGVGTLRLPEPLHAGGVQGGAGERGKEGGESNARNVVALQSAAGLMIALQIVTL